MKSLLASFRLHFRNNEDFHLDSKPAGIDTGSSYAKPGNHTVHSG